MEIYIEIFLVQNILINFCLLKLTKLTTKSQTTFLKLLTASSIGAFFSVISSMSLNEIMFLNIIKVITATAMLLIAFKTSIKQFVANFILLFMFTYAFGGLVTNFSTMHLLTQNMIIINNFTLEIICLLFIAFTYIFELVVRQIKFNINTNSLIFKIKIAHHKNTINIDGYLDTGNFLNHNGKPVLILNLDSYLKLTKSNKLDFYLKDSESLSTHTVNGNSNLKLFTVDKIEIISHKRKKQIIKNPYVAIPYTNCFKNTNYQALLSPLFL